MGSLGVIVKTSYVAREACFSYVYGVWIFFHTFEIKLFISIIWWEHRLSCGHYLRQHRLDFRDTIVPQPVLRYCDFPWNEGLFLSWLWDKQFSFLGQSLTWSCRCLDRAKATLLSLFIYHSDDSLEKVVNLLLTESMEIDIKRVLF